MARKTKIKEGVVFLPNNGKLKQSQVDMYLHVQSQLYFILRDSVKKESTYVIVAATINELKCNKGDLLIGYSHASKKNPLYGYLRLKDLTEDIATLSVEPRSNPNIVAIYFTPEEAYQAFNSQFIKEKDGGESNE